MRDTISPRSSSSGRTSRRRRSTRASPALTLVDGGQRLRVNGVQPPDHAAGLCRNLQQGRLRHLRLQPIERRSGAELHREVAPVSPIPKLTSGPDGRDRDRRLVFQQLHQPALEGVLLPERAVDLEHHAPVEDEHRVGIGRGNLDRVVGDALPLTDRIDDRTPRAHVVERCRPLLPGGDRWQKKGHRRLPGPASAMDTRSPACRRPPACPGAPA